MYFIWVSTQKAHIPYLLVVIICILFVLDWKEVHPFVCLWINIEKKLNLYIDKKKKKHMLLHIKQKEILGGMNLWSIH